MTYKTAEFRSTNASKAISRERVERAARIYHTAADAARALGITPRSFTRLCAKYGIDTPQVQKTKGLRR